MNFKKRVNGSWTDTSHYIHNTSTDTLTTLPADIYANDTTATVGLKGQMQQSGSPTPQNPIQPSECGGMTENLFYSSKNQTVGSTLHITQTIGNSRFVLNKDESQSDTSANIDIDITLPAGTYTMSVIGLNLYNNDYDRIFLRDDNSTIVVQNVQVNRPRSFTLTKTTHIYRATVVAAAQSTYNNTNVSIMLNSGSTALPYDKFGYKIPILSNSQTTNVYLGEVQSTRRIKKLVLTGEENWEITENNHYFRLTNFENGLVGQVVCTHYVSPPNAISISNTVQGIRIQDTSLIGRILIIRPPNYETETISGFKTYLAAQYAAGTPVIIWYVLAEPTIGIVNEPIRKIGDYADTLSNISIPVTAGGDTLSVGTTVQPSEVTVNYKGWHPVSSAHERSGGNWT